MLDKQLKDKFLSIIKDDFDQAQLILAYAGTRPAATFSVPKLRITEVTDFIKEIGLKYSIGRTNEDAEIIVGKEEWRVEALATEFLKLSSSAPGPPAGAPYREFLKLVANDNYVLDNLKRLAKGEKLDFRNNHAVAICIVPHIPHSPRCMASLAQGMKFSRVLKKLHPDLYWSVLKSRSSKILRNIESI